jgi:hypothetical protein
VICVEAAAILTGIMCIHIYNYVKCLIWKQPRVKNNFTSYTVSSRIIMQK